MGVLPFPWTKYAPDLWVELQQCLDEGREVEEYRSEVERILAMDGGEQCDLSEIGVAGQTTFAVSERREALAIALGERMKKEPVRPDYPYREPSDLPGIEALLGEPADLPFAGEERELLDRLRGAWTGRICGCKLGKPVEGCRVGQLLPFLKKRGLYPLRRYITLQEAREGYTPGELPWDPATRPAWGSDEKGAALPDDDTDYTVAALKLVKECGRDFTPEQVLANWLSSLPYGAVCTAERVAYRNGCVGLLPPQTATYLNPFREWIGAQIRTDFYGYINPGAPRAAAQMAWRDASISHTANGIYGAMFVAAMTAACFTEATPRGVIEAGLREIPASSRLWEDVTAVMRWHDEGASVETVYDRIIRKYPAPMWVHTLPNAMIVTAALLFSAGNFDAAVGIAVAGGYDTDCNGATVGSLMGALLGFSRIDPSWYAANDNRVITRVFGFSGDVSVEELVTETRKLL